MDENKNQIPDKFETYFTYFVAIFSLAVGGYGLIVLKEPSLTKWSVITAAVLTGGNDVMDKIKMIKK